VDEPGSGGLQAYVESTTYDDRGRVFQKFDASGGNRGTRMVYNEYGYLEEIREARDGAPSPGGSVHTYWTVYAMDARGNVIKGEMGNGMQVSATHDPVTGELTYRFEYQEGTGHFGQLMHYDWNEIGNLIQRQNLASTFDYEHFDYDDRDRLRRVWRSTTGLGSPESDSGE